MLIIWLFTTMIAIFIIPEFAQANSSDEPECIAHVGYEKNADLPGFSYQDPKGSVCIPFTQTSQRLPKGYQGEDFYIEEFTDAKIKKKWQEFSQDPDAARPIIELARSFSLSEFRNTGTVSPIGKIEPNEDVNLADIRRPAFFGQSVYNENIAKIDDKTYVVEFTVPRDTYERLHLKVYTPIKLRGWFIEGEGILDNTGNKTYAMAIIIGGRGIETTAIHHPDDLLYVYDPETKKYKGISYPNEQGMTEKWGLRQWRDYLYALNQAWFDVLTIDKRGHGISGGLTASDTGEQAEDLFRILDQLESGNGLRMLTPTGELLEGEQAVGKLLRGEQAKSVPLIIGGASQGSMVTAWAMQKNFAEFCPYNHPEGKCTSLYGYNIKGALMLADFAAGIGYAEPVYTLLEGCLRTMENVMFFPSSEILTNIDKWPAVFFGKGLWDNYVSVEDTFEAYKRATELKELVLVRGPHSENECGKENVTYMRTKIVEFAIQAVTNPGIKIPGPANLKTAVCSSPPYWEPSSKP